MSKGLTGFSELILLGAFLAFPSASPAQTKGGQAKPMVIHNFKHDVSPPLRHLPPSVQAGSAADQQQLVARPTEEHSPILKRTRWLSRSRPGFRV